ncbi:MAG: Lsr2 family protein [Actinomycetota bacterium]|nr:Lsr2 family protein [Actinomycetota bacterium]
MNIFPLAWLKAPQIIGGDVQHLVQGGVLLTRVFVERLVDDDVAGATETVDFSYRGVDYQIDLSARNARAVDKLLTQIVEGARRTEKSPAARRRGTQTRNRAPVAKAVRAWAKHEGIEVADRGRVAADVIQRFQDAHGG